MGARAASQRRSDRLAVEAGTTMSPRELRSGFSFRPLLPRGCSFPRKNNGICRRVYSSVKTKLAGKRARPSLRPAGRLFSNRCICSWHCLYFQAGSSGEGRQEWDATYTFLACLTQPPSTLFPFLSLSLFLFLLCPF